MKQAKQVRQPIKQALPLNKKQVHTITYSNDLEFSEHQKMAQTLSTNIYFPHASSSGERGLPKITNGHIQQYLPKTRRLDNVTQKKLKYVMNRLNH